MRPPRARREQLSWPLLRPARDDRLVPPCATMSPIGSSALPSPISRQLRAGSFRTIQPPIVRCNQVSGSTQQSVPHFTGGNARPLVVERQISERTVASVGLEVGCLAKHTAVGEVAGARDDCNLVLETHCT
jgi:hypothetical protein